MSASALSFGKTIGAVFLGNSLHSAIHNIVSGIRNLAIELTKNAGRMVDLSDKTGLSMKTLQQMSFVAKQTGVTIEQFSQAAFMLGVRVEKGGKGVEGAIRGMGLSIAELRSMSPDQMFNTVVAALERIEDPTKRNQLAVELFGRSFASIAPAITAGYSEIADAAEVASEAQIRALDKASDAWDAWVENRKANLTSFLGSLVLSVEGIRKAAGHGLGSLATLALTEVIGGVGAGVGAAVNLGGQTPAKDVFLPSPAAGGGGGASGPSESELRQIARMAEEVRKRRGAMTGMDSIAEAREMLADLAAVGGLTKITDDATEKLHKTLGEALAAYHRLGKEAPAEMTKVWAATMAGVPFAGGLTSLNGIGTDAGIPFAPHVMVPNIGMTSGLPAGVGTPMGMPQIPVAADSWFKTLFGNAGAFGGNIANALMGGGGLSGVGSMLGSQAMSGLFGQGGKFDIGKMMGSTGISGLLGGALGSLLPGVGSLLGPLIGKIGGFFKGLFGGGSEGRNMVEDFAGTFGGFDNLHEKLLEMGAAGEQLWVKLTQGVGRNNPEQARAVIDEINAALEVQAQRMQFIQEITGGVNARAANVSTQGDLDTVSAAAMASFGLQMSEGTGAVEALAQLTPAITAMKDAMAAGNFEMSTAGTKLLELAGIVETNRVPFQNLAADGQILSAMMKGNITDFDLFRTIAQDIGVQLQGMIDRGVPTAQVLALAQPQLQALWEAQQKWHLELDGTTQALMDQAVQQGIVGENMRSVHERTLQVLVAIADVLGADIPAALRGLPAVADQAAKGMNAAFSQVQAPAIDLGGEHVSGDLGGFKEMATGGIVRRPTLALIGEAGPEAVVPLSQASSFGGGFGGGGGINIMPGAVVVNGDVMSDSDVGEVVGWKIVEAIRLNRGGVGTGAKAALEIA